MAMPLARPWREGGNRRPVFFSLSMDDRWGVADGLAGAIEPRGRMSGVGVGRGGDDVGVVVDGIARW
jgi:hypothetical protein